ncbi:ABC transporter substrate-binding protein [Effusibacillus dendaii]|uniref:Sulfonate ABC transporter substrate-binding protein n=1 Tax=Effusibacillus dendaii TaxID=2743772 RepID=A0A7I8D7M8_9BACL|nr:ABC transporter substrate-binding protein [Effusibacillus dendaii]BCJ86148.1 sulfonate ABC transporter substrate-binding protein [Effusibacillus dendaii]
MIRISWNRKLSMLASFMLVSALVFGCGQSESKPASSEKSGDKIDKIEITVTHYPTGLYSLPYEVAVDKGFFKEEKIEIGGIVPGSGGGTTVRNVLSGKLPFGDVATSAAAQSFLSGAPIVIVAGSVQTFSDSFYVTRKDAPFQKAEDLVGHKWAFTSPGSATEAVSRLIFEKANIDPKSLEFVSSGGINEGLTLLEKGGVDATVIGEPLYSTKKNDYKTLFRLSDYVPKFEQSVIVTSPQLIQQNPSLVKRFLTAIQKADQWIYQNPEEAGKIFAKYGKIDETASIEAVKGLVKLNHWTTKVDVDGMNNVLKGMQYTGTLKTGTKIDWKELMNQTFLPQDQQIDTSKLIGN